MKERIKKIIEGMEIDNAVAVYGGAYHNCEKIMQELDEGELRTLARTIYNALDHNSFFKVESDEKVFNTLCHLFFVDPMLMKVYLGQ